MMETDATLKVVLIPLSNQDQKTQVDMFISFDQKDCQQSHLRHGFHSIMMETDVTLKVALILLRDFAVKNEAWNAFCF